MGGGGGERGSGPRVQEYKSEMVRVGDRYSGKDSPHGDSGPHLQGQETLRDKDSKARC